MHGRPLLLGYVVLTWLVILQENGSSMIVGALLRSHAHQSSHDLGKITGDEARVAGVAGVTAEQALIASRQRTARAGHPETQDQFTRRSGLGRPARMGGMKPHPANHLR